VSRHAARYLGGNARLVFRRTPRRLRTGRNPRPVSKPGARRHRPRCRHPHRADDRSSARLGIRTYGFLPMQLPEQMRCTELILAEDERIPIDALEFGTRAIQRLLERMAKAPQ
jgi:hypothetical protein